VIPCVLGNHSRLTDVKFGYPSFDRSSVRSEYARKPNECPMLSLEESTQCVTKVEAGPSRGSRCFRCDASIPVPTADIGDRSIIVSSV